MLNTQKSKIYKSNSPRFLKRLQVFVNNLLTVEAISNQLTALITH